MVNTVGNNVSVLLGDGDGTFQPAVNYAAEVEVNRWQLEISIATANWTSS